MKRIASTLERVVDPIYDKVKVQLNDAMEEELCIDQEADEITEMMMRKWEEMLQGKAAANATTKRWQVIEANRYRCFDNTRYAREI